MTTHMLRWRCCIDRMTKSRLDQRDKKKIQQQVFINVYILTYVLYYIDVDLTIFLCGKKFESDKCSCDRDPYNKTCADMYVYKYIVTFLL